MNGFGKERTALLVAVVLLFGSWGIQHTLRSLQLYATARTMATEQVRDERRAARLDAAIDTEIALRSLGYRDRERRRELEDERERIYDNTNDAYARPLAEARATGAAGSAMSVGATRWSLLLAVLLDLAKIAAVVLIVRSGVRLVLGNAPRVWMLVGGALSCVMLYFVLLWNPVTDRWMELQSGLLQRTVSMVEDVPLPRPTPNIERGMPERFSDAPRR